MSLRLCSLVLLSLAFAFPMAMADEPKKGAEEAPRAPA